MKRIGFPSSCSVDILAGFDNYNGLNEGAHFAAAEINGILDTSDEVDLLFIFLRGLDGGDERMVKNDPYHKNSMAASPVVDAWRRNTAMSRKAFVATTGIHQEVGNNFLKKMGFSRSRKLNSRGGSRAMCVWYTSGRDMGKTLDFLTEHAGIPFGPHDPLQTQAKILDEKVLRKFFRGEDISSTEISLSKGGEK